MLTDEYKINQEISSWPKNPEEGRIIPIYEDSIVKIYYAKKAERREKDSACWTQVDGLTVELKEKGITITHKPHLDPYVTFEENIVCMTSDGECWVCDVDTGAESSISMPIVAFTNMIDFEEVNDEYPNTFVIRGSGCYWGCEAYEQGYEIYIDKDTLEERYQDVWDVEGCGDEEEGSDEVDEDGFDDL
jgi:hypothetical protein